MLDFVWRLKWFALSFAFAAWVLTHPIQLLSGMMAWMQVEMAAICHMSGSSDDWMCPGANETTAQTAAQAASAAAAANDAFEKGFQQAAAQFVAGNPSAMTSVQAPDPVNPGHGPATGHP